MMIVVGFYVSMQSILLSNPKRAGSFVIRCSPDSLIFSKSSLCLLVVLA